jgi:hypothetical protein
MSITMTMMLGLKIALVSNGSLARTLRSVKLKGNYK